MKKRKKEKPLYFYADACTYFDVVFLGKCTGCAGIIPWPLFNQFGHVQVLVSGGSCRTWYKFLPCLRRFVTWSNWKHRP